jgi:hypothetical protein
MKLLLGILAVSALFFSACASTFVVSKDGKGYYLGNSSDAAYTMLCESGDFKKILAGTIFSQELKDDLYRYNCGSERSNVKVKQLFASMTPEQRKELRTSFKNSGYEINIMRC